MRNGHTLLCQFYKRVERFYKIWSFIYEKNEKRSRKGAHFQFRSKYCKELVVFITISAKIKVKIIASCLKNGWLSECSNFKSDMSACDNICQTKIEQRHVRFTKIYQLWPSSIALLEHSSLLLFSKNHFSKFLNFFSERIRSFGFPVNLDTEMQKQYIKLFINNKSESIHSFHDLSKQGMKGLIFLKLEP